MSDRLQIELDRLAEFHEVLTEDVAAYHAEACATALVKSGHSSGVELTVERDGCSHSIDIVWDREVGERQFRAHNDEKRRTDDAAVALALGTVHLLDGASAIERSETWDRVDYYLSTADDDHLIFNHGPRLEISGINRPTRHNSVKKRVKQKSDRLNEVGGPGHDGNTMIFVAEFVKPSSVLVRV